MKKYSRLASVEERKNIKKAYWYVILSILALVFLIFFGLPTLVKFAGFIGDIAKSDKPVEINDTTPPAPPQFDQVPEFTNSESIKIEGTSEDGAVIVIRSNNHSDEVVANSAGRFSFIFNLNDGENSIDAKAIDSSNNESVQTKTYKIVFDGKDPILEITSPADGTEYFGSGQRQLSIKGTVSEKVDLTINERVISTKDDGTFSFATTLSEGENKFDVKAVDPAKNEAVTSLTVTFTP